MDVAEGFSPTAGRPRAKALGYVYEGRLRGLCQINYFGIVQKAAIQLTVGVEALACANAMNRLKARLQHAKSVKSI